MTASVLSRLHARVRSTVSFRAATVWIVVLTTVVSCVAVPFKVTVDGIFYISSAKSLFKSDFTTDYAWFREPGYPLFLRIIHFIGNDGIFITLAQAVCLGFASAIALYCVLTALDRPAVPVGHLVVVIVLTLNPMYLIYSALVLQQALFALQLALFSLGVVWALRRPPWLGRWALIGGVIVAYAAAIWTSIGWIYLGLFPVVLTISISFSGDVRRLYGHAESRTRRVMVVAGTAVAIGALSTLTYQGALTTYSGWQAVKAPHIYNLTIPAAVIEPPTTIPHVPTPVEMTRRMLALMHIGTVGSYVYENDLFLRQQMIPDRALGLWDTKYVSQPYTTYAAGWVSIPNPSEQVHFVYAQLAVIAPVEYPVVFVGYLLALLLALIRREWRLVLVLAVPFTFLAVYAASNSPIDRYGIPAYPMATAAVGTLLLWLVEMGGRLHRSRSRRNPSD